MNKELKWKIKKKQLIMGERLTEDVNRELRRKEYGNNKSASVKKIDERGEIDRAY